MKQEVIKSMLSKLDITLEFDEGIAVNSVEELKSKYDTFVKENFQEAQTETTTTGGMVSTKHKETHCTHFHTISGLQCWCDKGVFPPDCATCTQGDWEEYLVEVTSTSTNKD